MAKKPNDKRTERMLRKDRNVNLATCLLMAGLIAEFYLLLINRYFVKGTVGQVLAANSFLRVMTYVGLAAAVAGAVMLAMRKKNARCARYGGWVLGCGVFFAFSSILMRKIYNGGTTAMCILVPVAMILGIIALLYQREFAVESAALAVSIAALALLNVGADKPGWVGLVKGCAAAALALLAAITLCTAAVKKNGGVLGSGGKQLRVFPDKADYRLVFGTLALCLALLALALIVPGAAFYGMWILAVAAFCLAVYYTIKLL